MKNCNKCGIAQCKNIPLIGMLRKIRNSYRFIIGGSIEECNKNMFTNEQLKKIDIKNNLIKIRNDLNNIL